MHGSSGLQGAKKALLMESMISIFVEKRALRLNGILCEGFNVQIDDS